ncbi:MAG TPA: Hsp20/alpha crystallin family protein [Gemmatimonadaceae bacterium]|nr:Hsp20/alpha crystallin family protein [Gemmatimonadaceae bacterium]
MPNEPSKHEQERVQQHSGSSTSTSSSQRERERSIETRRDSESDGRRGELTRRAPGGLSYGGSFNTSPFVFMRRMVEDMERMFDDFGVGRSPLGLSSPLLSPTGRDIWRDLAAEQARWSPQIEMRRRGEKLIVRADLPGLQRDDVNVEIDNGVLTISGERCVEETDDREGMYRSERSYGEFYRAIPLPDGVNADQTEATFKDGVLEITLSSPSTPNRHAKRIPVR